MFKFDDKYLDPPDDSENAVLECENCKRYIYNGDFYFVVNGTSYCEECAQFEFGRYADFEDFEKEEI